MERRTPGAVVRVVMANMPGQFRTRFQVVGTAHHQVMWGGVMRFKRVRGRVQGMHGLFFISGRPIGDVPIPVIQVGQQNLAAIGRLPLHQRGGPIRNAAPQARGVDAETLQNLGHLADVTEGVRDVTHHHTLPEQVADLPADEQVANRGFR